MVSGRTFRTVWAVGGILCILKRLALCSATSGILYNPRVVTVEIVTIGNEILLGLVQDTNSNYLCRVVRGMAGRVRHIAVVRDEIDAIGASIKASMRRGAELIFTCGGLGP